MAHGPGGTRALQSPWNEGSAAGAVVRGKGEKKEEKVEAEPLARGKQVEQGNGLSVGMRMAVRYP